MRPLGYVLAAVVAFAALLYAASPWLIERLAAKLAPQLGLDALRIEVGHPGLRGVTVATVDAVGGRFRVAAADVRVGYALGDVLGGRVDTVSVAQLDVRVDDAAASDDSAGPRPLPVAPPAALPDPAALFARLPWRAARVQALTLAVPALAFSAEGTLAVDGGELALALRGVTPVRAEGFELDLRLTPDGRVALRLADGAAPPFLSLDSVLDGDRLALTGEARLDGFVLDLAAALAGVPAGTGSLAGRVEASAPWPLPDRPDWATVDASGSLSVAWRPGSGNWRLDGSDVRWRLADGTLTAGIDAAIDVADQPLEMQARVGRLVLPELTGAGTLALLSPSRAASPPRHVELDWRLGPAELDLEGVAVLQEPLLSLARSRLGLPDGDAALRVGFQTRLPWPLPAPAEIRVQADGTVGGHWQAPALDIALSALDGTWRLDGRRLDARLGARIAHAGVAADVGLVLDPLEWTDAALAARGQLRLGKLAALPFEAAQALDGGAGSLSLHGPVRISEGLAAQALVAWAQPFDLAAGEIDVAADLAWATPDRPGGRIRIGLKDVSADYDEYRVTGLNAELDVRGDDGAWALASTPLRIATLATGVPLEAVTSAVAWSGDTVRLQATRARLLGGSLRIAPFDYAIAGGSARFTVELEGLSLAEVLALEGEQVAGTGVLSGSLPVVLTDNAPSIVGGRVRAEPPGGTIRVADALAGGTGQPGLDFALRALKDFRYQVLDADVGYAADGNLTLAVRLEGRNPDIEAGRPIHYNLTLNENIPVLLESLRLERDLTRGIERRLNK